MAGDLAGRLVNSVKQVAGSKVTSALTDAIMGKPNTNLSIDTFVSKFLGLNARSYLFQYQPNFPSIIPYHRKTNPININSDLMNISTGVGGQLDSVIKTTAKMINTSMGSPIGADDLKYFVKTTSLPEVSVEETSTYFLGQQMKMSSVRRTQDWTVEMYVDLNGAVINSFWEWNKSLQDPVRNNSPVDAKQYMADQTIQLLGLDGTPILTYKLISAWPKSIGQIDLDYSANDFATVNITFAYQYFTIETAMSKGINQSGARNVVQNAIGGSINRLLGK